MTVSLIVTTYNWPQALALVLISAMDQTVLPDEIVMADDGSISETAELIRNIAKESMVPIYHAWQPDEGFRAASARNGAIRRASGEYLILIDGDMILHPRFIEDHLSYAKRGTFVQGSRVLLDEKKSEEVLQKRQYGFSLFEAGIHNRKNAFHSNMLYSLFSKDNSSLKGIKSCNFALFREDIDRVNGFNEDFIGWGREDSELAVRLMNAGIKRRDIRFHAIAYHLYHRENTRTSLPENDERLQEAIAQKKIWCDKGLA
ncbi:MAG: glycosyltransferase family 2 protein [Campylobacterota bacterium]|nr:glycosyltransferase family 2 protein [Campylobacterota bacterium]